MDVFARTFLPAAAGAGLPIPVVSRHMPVLRRCVSPEETAMLVARSHRPGLPIAGEFLLLVTNRQLVVTRQSRLLPRVQLHLAAGLRDLGQVSWITDPWSGVELAATAADGVRERFWLPAGDPHRVRLLEALLSHAFPPRTGAPGSSPRTGAPPAAGPHPAAGPPGRLAVAGAGS